jgi:hypothetical protein
VPSASWLVPLLLALPVGCADPVREQAVAALGGEDPGVEPGPLHRPGQPCLVCHDAAGPSVFSLAGTVYARPEGRVPVAKVTVELIDADGQAFKAVTNCAGNFLVRPEDYTPRYPLWVTLAVGDQKIDMESPVFRDGSCASCHGDPKGPASAGHAYFLLDENPDLPANHYCK